MSLNSIGSHFDRLCVNLPKIVAKSTVKGVQQHPPKVELEHPKLGKYVVEGIEQQLIFPDEPSGNYMNGLQVIASGAKGLFTDSYKGHSLSNVSVFPGWEENGEHLINIVNKAGDTVNLTESSVNAPLNNFNAFKQAVQTKAQESNPNFQFSA